ncbi:hypothetical protein AHAS_Ahas03G0248000 [Arachis hypogaea]
MKVGWFPHTHFSSLEIIHKTQPSRSELLRSALAAVLLRMSDSAITLKETTNPSTKDKGLTSTSITRNKVHRPLMLKVMTKLYSFLRL